MTTTPEGELDPNITLTNIGRLAAGQASLMALESLMLLLIEKRVIAAEDVVEAVEVTIDAKRNLGLDGEDERTLAIAIGMLKKLSISISSSVAIEGRATARGVSHADE